MNGIVIPQKVKRKRIWLRRLLVLAVALTALACTHRWILSRLGGLLVIDEGLNRADAVLIFDQFNDDGRIAAAARLHLEGYAPKILMLAGYPLRAERLGIFPAEASLARSSIKREGVAPDKLTILQTDGNNDWERARGLEKWLNDHPEERVIVLCGEFESRKKWLVFRQVLNDAARKQLLWRALPERAFGVQDWWLHKQGLKRAFAAATGILHIWLIGESKSEKSKWSPDDYEKSLSDHP